MTIKILIQRGEVSQDHAKIKDFMADVPENEI